jgi:hypothetical protein
MAEILEIGGFPRNGNLGNGGRRRSKSFLRCWDRRFVDLSAGNEGNGNSERNEEENTGFHEGKS